MHFFLVVLAPVVGLMSVLTLLGYYRLQKKGIKTILLSGDREEAVATIATTVGIESGSINASLTPQQKSGIISNLQSNGHHIAMVT